MNPETLHQWREMYVQFCPTCKCDTLTLNSGLCGWCDTRLREPFESHESPEAFGDSAEDLSVVPPDGSCRHCRVVLADSVTSAFYCSARCERLWWRHSTPKGREWKAREVERSRVNRGLVSISKRDQREQGILVAVRKWAELHGRPPLASDWSVSGVGWPKVGSVVNAFGSWGKAIERAGLERPAQSTQSGEA